MNTCQNKYMEKMGCGFMSSLNNILIEELHKHGLKAKITSVEHINEIRDEIIYLKEQSLLNEQFYNENLSWMDYNYSNTMPNAKSILVIAYPQSMTHLKLEYNGKNHIVITPPTYVYSDVYDKMVNIVNMVLTLHQYSIVKTRLPAKLLAVRTGLGSYGRNNICYINGMGSFHRLFTFFTDMPNGEDNWRETTVMPECSNCSACTSACPTNAIDSQRFLIHAERCITHFNESEGNFPEWLDKSWHNAIVGCMKCQIACPKNREFISRVESEITFNAEEVGALLQKSPLEQLPCHLRQKLDKLNLTEYYDVIQRNLSVLIS